MKRLLFLFFICAGTTFAQSGQTSFTCPTAAPCLVTPLQCGTAPLSACTQSAPEPQRRAWNRTFYDRVGDKWWEDTGDNFGQFTFSAGWAWTQYVPTTLNLAGMVGFTMDSDCGEHDNSHGGAGNNGPTIISNVAQILTAPITSSALSMPVTSTISNAAKIVPVAQFNINSTGGVNCEFASGTCPETPLLWIDDELVEYCSLNTTSDTIFLGIYNGAADDGTGATSCVGGTTRAAGSGRGMFGTLAATHNPYLISGAQIPNIFGACPAPQGGALANGGTMVRMPMHKPDFHPWRMEMGEITSNPANATGCSTTHVVSCTQVRLWTRPKGETGVPPQPYFYSPQDGYTVEVPNMGGQGEEDGALENDPAHKIFLSYGGQTVKSSGNFTPWTYVACYDTSATIATLNGLGCARNTGTFAYLWNGWQFSCTSSACTIYANNNLANGDTVTLTGFANSFLNVTNQTVSSVKSGQFNLAISGHTTALTADTGTVQLTTSTTQCIINSTCNRLYVFNLLQGTATAWAATHSFSQYDQIQATVGGTTYNFLAMGGGTSGGSAPAWTATVGATQPVDGSVTWINAGAFVPLSCSGNRWDGTACSSADSFGPGSYGPGSLHVESLTYDSHNQGITLFGGQNNYTSATFAPPLGCPAIGMTLAQSKYPYGVWNFSNCEAIPNDVWFYSANPPTWTKLATTANGQVPAGHQRPALAYNADDNYYLYWLGPWDSTCIGCFGEYDHGLYKLVLSCSASCTTPPIDTATWTAINDSSIASLPFGQQNNSAQQISIPWNQQFSGTTDHCHLPGDALFNSCDGGYENLDYDPRDSTFLYKDAYGGAGSNGGIQVVYQLPKAAIVPPNGAPLANLTVQNMCWPGSTCPSGTDSNLPVTVGIPVAESVGGTGCGDFQLQNSGGTAQNWSCQILAQWPSGKTKVLLADFQESSFASGPTGVDSSFTLAFKSGAGGNQPTTPLAIVCTGANTPDKYCPDNNHIVVRTIGAAATVNGVCSPSGTSACFLVKIASFNGLDEVNLNGTLFVSQANHGANDGVLIMGPTPGQTGVANQVSCAVGGCSTAYVSNLDATSTAVIEEPGSMRTALLVKTTPVAASSSGGTTIPVNSSCSNFQSQLNSITTAGIYTVTIPATTCTIGTEVDWTQPAGANVIIQGAGAITPAGGTDLTILQNNISGTRMLDIITSATGCLEITGIAFTAASGNTTSNDNGNVNIYGQSNCVRVDHNHFNVYVGLDLLVGDSVQGVIDHNEFDSNHSDEFGIRFNDNKWNGATSDGEGNNSWADSDHFGSSQFMFAENNTFQWVGGGTNHGFAFDCEFGGRFVFRNNTVGFHTALQTHGTDAGSGDFRGCRAQEVYNNTFTYSSTPTTDNFSFLVQYESGTGLWWGNTVTAFKGIIHADTQRTNNATYPETATPNGWGFCSPTPIAGVAGPSNWDQNTSGQNGWACLDQVGRGKGDLLTGLFPSKVDSVTSTITWPNQALDPMYVWANTFNPVSGATNNYFNSADLVENENRDYYLELPNVNEATTFNGTAGIGSGGVIPSSPAAYPGAPTCTSGVGWWYTTTPTLYQCQSGVWRVFYTPFTFPHPLTVPTYAPCTVRMHFYANRTDVRMQTICPRNAQQPSSLTAPGSDFQTAAKQYKSAELVETWNPSGGTTNWGIGNHTTTPTSGTGLTGSSVINLYQGYSAKHLSQDVGSQLVNCSGTIADACYTSPISRTGSPGSWTYAQSGYQINAGAIGSQTNIVTGNSAQYPPGWADVDDGTKGVEIGVEDLAGNWPKALELAAGGTEIHIGIAPDQSLFLGGRGQDYLCSYTAYCGDTNTIWYFHTGTLSTSSYAAAREEFLDFQHPLIARAPVGYYNQACQISGPVCFFPNQIPDPVAEDTYLTSANPHLNCGHGTTTPGTCLDDVQDATQAGTQPTPMSVFTAYNWGQSGAGNQHDVMEAFLQNWVQRGYTTTTGSVPGRYAFGRNFIRNVADRALPHSDWSGALGNNGWRMLCTGTPSAPACPANTFDNWGWPAKVNSILPAGTGTANMGMRNWCDEVTSEDHCWPWAIVDWYFLTGDRNLYDSIRQGGYDRFNLQLGYNNGLAGPNPGHGNMGVTRATGHSLSWIARLCEFSLDTSDNTNFPCQSPSVGAKSTGIALAGENIFAYVVQNPLIDAGYPAGATDTAGCPDNSIGGQGTAACSAGISPVRGLHYGGESDDFISTIPISSVTGDGAGHATAVCATTCGSLVNGSSIFVSGITPTTFDCAPIACASIASVAGTTLTINYVSTSPSGSGTASGNGAQPSGSGPMQVDAHLPPGDATNHGTVKAFMESIFEEGVFEFCQMEEYIRGYDWSGVAFTGVANGTSSATQTLDDRSCLQRAYAVGNYMDQEHFQPATSWNPGGMGYDNFFHYLNATPPGFNGANAKISLPNGAANGTNYGDWGYGLCGVVGPKAGIPSTFAATPNLWQPDYELYQSQVQAIGNSYPQERYSHMAYATDSCILNGSANPNQYTPDTTTSTLQPVQGFTVTDGTNSGFCVGSAACTINWTGSSSLAILGSAMNKNPTPYWLVQNSCTVGSSGCPSSGLQIVNWEKFHNNCQTSSTTIECTNGTGLATNNPCSGGMNAVADPTTGQSPGCWEAGVTPDTHVNFFAATPVYPQPTASATSATFTCATGQVCTAALYAYQQQLAALSSVTLTPTNQTFASSPIGVTSADSPETFTLTNSSGSIVTSISISLIGADPSDYSDMIPATTCSTSLAIGASCQIFVSFAPVATGVRTASLSISDSATGSPQSSSLSGTAIPPVINPTPANPVTFGVAITDPSIPSTVTNEKYKEVSQSSVSNASSPSDTRARQINTAYNFDHVDLFGFLHQERPSHTAGASSR
jgi:hypothetical protein